MPSSAFPKGAFSKAEEVIDRPLISNILMDEPILEGRLAVRGSGLGLAPIIPVGMRAVTVRVNDVTGIAGFRAAWNAGGRAGDRTSAQRGWDRSPPRRLQNMLVLSAGTAMQPDARGQAMQAATVTLLATPEQAETLTLANAEGTHSVGFAERQRSDHREDPGTRDRRIVWRSQRRARSPRSRPLRRGPARGRSRW